MDSALGGARRAGQGGLRFRRGQAGSIKTARADQAGQAGSTISARAGGVLRLRRGGQAGFKAGVQFGKWAGRAYVLPAKKWNVSLQLE